MKVASAVHIEGAPVLRGRVAHVPFPPPASVPFSQLRHQMIAVDLGENGRRGHGEVARVRPLLHHHFSSAPVEPNTINDHDCLVPIQTAADSLHRDPGGTQDVHLVDDLRPHLDRHPPIAALTYPTGGPNPCRAGNRLRVLNLCTTRNVAPSHTCDYHRTCQRAPAHLVDTYNPLCPPQQVAVAASERPAHALRGASLIRAALPRSFRM